MLTVLGIESSCDETAAAVVRAAEGDGPGAVLANEIFSQDALHARFGGVVPEIAARAHAERLDVAVEEALDTAGVTLRQLDAVAVTAGPGLIGGVLAGVMFAKGLTAAAGLPLIGINHLEGHALTPRLADGLPYPYLLLLVSGGHCQLIEVAGLGRYRRLGGTIDDAPGEAFDKAAKMLGLGFPGGPEVERWARNGDPGRFDFPRPLLDRPGIDMSFSGLKTALRRARDRLVESQGGVRDTDIADLCAGFQAAIGEVLAEKTRRSMEAFRSTHGGARRLAVAGGVAANLELRARLEHVAAAEGFDLSAPPLRLCTDNGAIIAWAGIERLRNDGIAGEITARPRWPLDREAAPMLGSGKRGAKA